MPFKYRADRDRYLEAFRRAGLDSGVRVLLEEIVLESESDEQPKLRSALRRRASPHSGHSPRSARPAINLEAQARLKLFRCGNPFRTFDLARQQRGKL
jgi:hypothetical protein